MAQSYHETLQYTKWEESLVYKTAERLPVVWPKRFSMLKNDATGKLYAPDYINNAEKLSNAVYSDRYGNGNIASGDGWKYRGRGAFHLTFKGNYSAASQGIYSDDRLVVTPDLVATDWDARWATAGWFWDLNKFNTLADADQFTRVSTIIQGDASTVPQRLIALKRSNEIFTG